MPFKPDAILYNESHQDLISKAEKQLDLLLHNGRQLIEALAGGGQQAAVAQQVTEADSAANAAIAAAETHMLELGPLLHAAAGQQALSDKDARAALLILRKDALDVETAGSAPDMPSAASVDRPESEMLDRLVQQAASATDLPFELRDASGSLVAAGDATEVRMIVEGMLCATVALVAAGRPEPARVALMSADEAAAGKDAWHTSAHQVFRRASDVAMQALAHYLQRAQQAWSEVGMEPAAARKLACSSALEDLLLYLSTYRDLFRRPCTATGRLLALDPVSNQLLPPIVRPFKRPRSVLLAIARDSETCQAFHPHSVPAYV